MASIERTACPRLKRGFNQMGLRELFSPTEDEIDFAGGNANAHSSALALLVLLKCCQLMGYFPDWDSISKHIIAHVKNEYFPGKDMYWELSTRMLCSHHSLVRERVQAKVYDHKADELVTETMATTVKLREDPVDLINRALEELIINHYELPAYSRLDTLAAHIRNLHHEAMFTRIFTDLPPQVKYQLNTFLHKDNKKSNELYQKLRSYPANPSISNFKDWLKHLKWLESIGSVDFAIRDIAYNKLYLLAEQAYVLDVGELKDFGENKQTSLLACLLWKTRRHVKDQLVEMLIRRVQKAIASAKTELEQIHLNHVSLNEELVDTLEEMLEAFDEGNQLVMYSAQDVKDVIDKRGGVSSLLEKCLQATAHRGKNFYPLLYKDFKSDRTAFYQFLENLSFSSTNEYSGLRDAMDVLLANNGRAIKHLPAVIPLDFISNNWKKIIFTVRKSKSLFVRSHLEACTGYYMNRELQNGNLAVIGSESYDNFKDQLLEWSKCELLLPKYCTQLGLPSSQDPMVEQLQDRLEKKADFVDSTFPKNNGVRIDDNGEIVLSKVKKREPTKPVQSLLDNISTEMPQRTMLEILSNSIHRTGFTRHFHPLSGSDPKLKNQDLIYCLTAFTYGCNIGPAEFSRHLSSPISPNILSYTNQKHITARSLDLANADIVNVYQKLQLPNIWGEAKRGAVDGTHVDMYHKNIMASYHIRYGAYGGIAYHHVSDLYIALFSQFIPCGVWEAVYIIEGLMENPSDVNPTVIHGDTQAQNVCVFALAYLLGIDLMPRIRNWKGLTFFRPSKNAKYNNIDSLFTDVIDWELIRKHWKDMMQVIISIQEGIISSALILKKLRSESKSNRLYMAFRELGRVLRTIFLLDFISDPNLRRTITATTNKVEQFNWFSDFFSFGSQGKIRTNDPVEQEKRIKYNTLVANAAMLQNVIDMTQIVNSMIDKGIKISENDLYHTNPYSTHNIQRFGLYKIDESLSPPPPYEMNLHFAV